MIILQVFVFDKTYHLVLRNSDLVYSFASCFSTIPLNKTKLKYGAMKLKVYEKFIWMIELGATYLLGSKGSFSVHPESTLSVYLKLHFLWCDYGCD